MSDSATNEDGANPQPTTLTISSTSLLRAGLESQVRSWIDNGPNEAITADQIVSAVGEDRLAQAAASLGREPGDLAAGLAAELPRFVDAASSEDRTASGSEGRDIPELRIRFAPLNLEAVIHPKQNLDLSTEVLLDGSATLEVVYL
ncbi:YidB family protein [Streptomyces goshikiensis]|uniref:YidB family protein n=1 Tax=Streptomyces goshikiensis TaxID=1942 RepID=UPI0036C70046